MSCEEETNNRTTFEMVAVSFTIRPRSCSYFKWKEGLVTHQPDYASLVECGSVEVCSTF